MLGSWIMSNPIEIRDGLLDKVDEAEEDVKWSDHSGRPNGTCRVRGQLVELDTCFARAFRRRARA